MDIYDDPAFTFLSEGKSPRPRFGSTNYVSIQKRYIYFPKQLTAFLKKMKYLYFQIGISEASGMAILVLHKNKGLPLIFLKDETACYRSTSAAKSIRERLGISGDIDVTYLEVARLMNRTDEYGTYELVKM